MRARPFGIVLSCAATTLMAGASTAHDGGFPDRFVTAALHKEVQNIVVIYAENRSFDNIFGTVPGAHGLNEVVDGNGKPRHSYLPQCDRDGSVLPTLPQTWGGVTA